MQEGTDLAAYNSLENAADIEALRTALGYDQINLYGVSYGTLLALHALRLYPGALRSVILDGVVPPQINFLTEAPRAHDRSLHRAVPRLRGGSGLPGSLPGPGTRHLRPGRQAERRPGAGADHRPGDRRWNTTPYWTGTRSWIC